MRIPTPSPHRKTATSFATVASLQPNAGDPELQEENPNYGKAEEADEVAHSRDEKQRAEVVADYQLRRHNRPARSGSVGCGTRLARQVRMSIAAIDAEARAGIEELIQAESDQQPRGRAATAPPTHQPTLNMPRFLRSWPRSEASPIIACSGG